jgi:hypothetical protein
VAFSKCWSVHPRSPLWKRGEGEMTIVLLESYPRIASMEKKVTQMKIEVPYDRLGLQPLIFAPAEVLVLEW